MKRTITLYKHIENELAINRLYNNDDIDENLMQKIFNYDSDVSKIIDDLFNHIKLPKKEHDKHFKQYFLYRFLNREINQQTVGSFKVVLASTFLSNYHFIKRIYEDMEKHILNKKVTDNKNKQTSLEKVDGESLTDGRSAFADLPQSTVNLDINNTTMNHPTDNTITRNKENQKQKNKGYSQGENTVSSVDYNIDDLFKSSGVLENVLNVFDVKCFLQIW